MSGPVDEHVADYAASHTTRSSDTLQRVAASTVAWRPERSEMMVDEAEGQLLRMLVALVGARRVLEVGTFSGYSALAMAEALPPDGQIDTLELDAEHAAKAAEHIREAGEDGRIRIHLGPALDTLAILSGPYDLTFIDAHKADYPGYYELIVPLMRGGGLIVADNVLGHGRVLDPANESPLVAGMRAFNERAATDPRVDTVMLTVRDGVSLIRLRD